jgi:hypothetical protein
MSSSVVIAPIIGRSTQNLKRAADGSGSSRDESHHAVEEMRFVLENRRRRLVHEIHRFRLAPRVRLRGAAETIGRTDGSGGRRRPLPRAVG